MNRIICNWIAVLALAGLAGLGLSSCNVAESGESHILRMRLDDSLAVESNLFKTIDIDLFDSSGNMTHADVFKGPYYLADSATLANLAVASRIPNPVTIRVTAYKDTDVYWVFTIKVANGNRESLTPVYTGPSNPINPNPIVPNPIDTLAPTRIIITSPATQALYLGDPSISLAALAEPPSAVQTVVWTLSSGDAALLEPGDRLKAVKAGTVTLVAASAHSPSVTATLEMTILNAPTVLPATVVINNTSPLSLTVGGASVALDAAVLPAEAKQDIKWTLPSNTVAMLEPGNLIKGLSPGTVTVTASSALAPSVFDTLVVTVQDPPAVLPTLITLTSPSLTLLVGAPPVTLGATVSPAEASQDLIWSFDAPGVVEIVNNNQVKGLKAGTAKVTATSAVKSTVTADLNVVVEAPVITPDSLFLRMATPMVLAVGGADVELVWTVLPAGADQGVDWTSSDTTIAGIIGGNKVRPLKSGPAKITGKSKAKPTITATFDVNVIVPVKVDAISILPKTLTLYTGGPEGKLTVTLTGNDPGAQFTLSSSDPAIATVSAAGSVKGLAAGSAIITAAVVGYPAVTSACTVQVIKDPPVVTLTPDQVIAYGGEAVFSVSVTQKFGTVVEIKADMDGNGTFEKSVLAKDTATFKATYTEVKIFNLSFEIKDSEGNVVALSRKVTVTAPAAPVVKIIDPATAITVNTGTYTLKFTVKDPTKAVDEAKDSSVTLVSGPNTIKVTRTNIGGSGSAQVVITLDNTAPGTPTFVAQPAYTSDNTPTWTWTAVPGAAKYQVRLNDGDFTKSTGTIDVTLLTYTSGVLSDGPHTLYLRSLDELGNASTAASQLLNVKTSLPATPVLVGSPAAISSVRTPEWTWKSGDATKGNGTFKVWLNDVAQPNATVASFKPATAQADGKYILKVKELDALGQESAAFLTFAQITIDGTKPSIVVTGYANGSVNSLSTTAKVAITGTIVDGSTGSGIVSATYSLSGKTTKAATAVSTPATFSLGTITLTNGGITTLTVNATDAAGNSQSYSVDFNVQIPMPTLTFDSRTPRAGYITSSTTGITVFYVANGVGTSEVVNIPEPTSGETSNSVQFSKTVQNEAGSATISRTFYRARRDVRFFKPTGTAVSPAACIDWEHACKFAGDLQGNGFSGTMWLENGTYDVSGNAVSVSETQIYGGLKANAINANDLASGQVSKISSTDELTKGTRLLNGSGMTRMTITGSYELESVTCLGNLDYKLKQVIFTGLTPRIPYNSIAFQPSGHNVTCESCTFDIGSQFNTFVQNQFETGFLTFLNCTFIGGATGQAVYSGNPHPQAIKFLGTTTGSPAQVSPDNACGLPGIKACN